MHATNFVLSGEPVLRTTQQLKLLTPVIEKDVKLAMFSIDNIMSPGPNGYGSGFFKT